MNCYSSILQHVFLLLVCTFAIYFIDWYKFFFFIVDRHTAVFKITWLSLVLYFTYLSWNNPQEIERLIACHMILLAIVFGRNRMQDYDAYRVWLEKLKVWISFKK